MMLCWAEAQPGKHYAGVNCTFVLFILLMSLARPVLLLAANKPKLVAAESTLVPESAAVVAVSAKGTGAKTTASVSAAKLKASMMLPKTFIRVDECPCIVCAKSL